VYDCRNGNSFAAVHDDPRRRKYYSGAVFDIPERRLEALMSIGGITRR